MNAEALPTGTTSDLTEITVSISLPNRFVDENRRLTRMRPTARACSLALPAVVAAALAVGAAPVHADSMVGPFDFGSFDFGGSLGSSKKGPQHYGKLGRPVRPTA